METYVAPYVQVRHAIHLLYATSPRSRDGADDAPAEAELNNRRLHPTRMGTFLNPPRTARDLWDQATAPVNHRYDKLGNPLPMELHGCGCGLCARQRRAQLRFWEAR
jgi:hypothetical protein